MTREEAAEEPREERREEVSAEPEEVWQCPDHDKEHWIFGPCPAADHHCLNCCVTFLETGTEEEFSQTRLDLEPWDEKLRAE